MKKFLYIAAAVAILAVAALILRPAPEPNLEGFVQLTKADPLFYSSFFEQGPFEAALGELRAAEARLTEAALANIATLPDGPQKETYQSIVGRVSLFPHDFLETLADISVATDAFLENPSLTDAESLLALYSRAAEAYNMSAENTLAVFDRIKEYQVPERPYLYFFTESATSADIVHADFRLIRDNAHALSSEVARRQKCLSGRGSCTANDPRPEHAAEDVASAFATPDTLGEYADFVRATLPFSPAPQDVRGPYRIASGCFPGDEQWMYLVYQTTDGTTRALPKLATQNYYRLVSPTATDEISKAVLDLDLQFYSQAEGTTYECTDLSFYPLLITADFLERDMESQGVTVDVLLSEDAYRLLAENQFGRMAPALVALASYTDLLAASQHISDDFILSPQFLFSTRSAYGLTYLPFARSVWRIEHAPTYLFSKEERARMSVPSPFATLDQLEASGYSRTQIRRAHLPQDEFIRSLID